jgi:hypothetical protein
MDIAIWAAFVPVATVLVTAVVTVLVVVVTMKGTASHDRAMVLQAVAEVVRAVRGHRG